ncbi:MAG: hypothetical protein IJP62_01275 [Treponema sp.]|nr:hypothetical protein [Treponema sp.]
MPGLSQLRQFSEDIKELGDEVRIRRTRGEMPSFLPVPDVPDVDDSNDFMLGIPDPNADKNASENSSAPAVDFGATEDVDFSSLGISGVDDIISTPSASSSEPVDIPPELAAILGPAGGGAPEMPDLSDFLDEPVSAPNDVSAPADDSFSAPQNASASENAVPLGQDELDKLFASSGTTETSSENAVPLDQSELDKLFSSSGNSSASAENSDTGGTDALPDLSEFYTEADETASSVPDSFDQPDASSELAAEFSVDENLQEPDDIPQIPDLGDLPDAGSLGTEDTLPDFNTNFSLPDDLPPINDLVPADSEKETSVEAAQEEFPAEPISDESSALTENAVPLDQGELDKLFSSSKTESSPASADDFSTPDDFDFSGDAIDMGSEEPSENALTSAATSSSSDMTDLLSGLDFDNLPDETTFGETPSASLDDFGSDSSSARLEPVPDAEPLPSFDDTANAFDTSGLDSPESSGLPPLPTDAVPDMPLETFDTSEMDGLDFSSGGTGAALPFDDEFPVTGESGDDFELTDDFEIPGFSDTDTVPVDKKKGGFRLDSPDFSKAGADRPPNTLTEKEYETFRKNLSNYPLNLRIAVEDFIVKDEFKDDVIFEVIEKVLKKASARQIAGHLEKLLDISIDVPRDYERRSVAEYEAYKQSFQYQLKNRILPAVVAGLVFAFFGFFLFQVGKRFVYQPLMANSLYKQGYTMIENNEYPQSEELFKEAVGYKPVKKWFFRYAQGYRAHKQYERAAQMYRNILGFFNYDKQAGLEYADMELYDRANYSRAEQIVRRDVLDHHINDSDGLLLLGDIFLEWADIDNEKYELARAEYSNLIQLYGATDLYMSRMMRYFIRTDNLPNVLGLKKHFYPRKKSLGAADWTELSGYLLDKLYGNLSKTEEGLRSSIEDVLDMLNTAVKLDPVNPVARYNLSRYFLHNGNDAASQREMQIALDLFEKAPVRTRKNTYREINGNRILGELFARNREYIKAQEVYTRGINVYAEEHEKTGLEGDENTGKLYADLADIDYFIAGDMVAALENYRTAVSLKNDTPTLNYRIGAIHYNNKDYDKALGFFIKTSETKGNDANLLLSLGNTLSLRGDNFAAQGYYSDLLTRLNDERARRVLVTPQIDDDDYELVDRFLKTNNNLGVTLYRIARQTGDSGKNAEALVRLSDSMRAWDALTRNPETMVRLEGSNLASQNSKYIMHPYSDFEPTIYTDIPKTLTGEGRLE